MKKIIRYKCEVCHNEYDNEVHALDCESRGLPKFYPIGCMYGNHTAGSFYEKITFAVASNKHMPRSHMNVGGSWACRDIPGVGDSLGEERCGSGDLNLQEYDGNLNPDHPTFKRMVNYLQSQGIDVTVWDGEKPVLLEKWLEERASSKIPLCWGSDSSTYTV